MEVEAIEVRPCKEAGIKESEINAKLLVARETHNLV
jgi:hypothetical protein